jgi:hypothetical protein
VEKIVDRQITSEHISRNNGTFIEKCLQAKTRMIYINCSPVLILLESNGLIFNEMFLNLQIKITDKINTSLVITITAT